MTCIPAQGSSAIGLGLDFFLLFLWCWWLDSESGIRSSSVSTWQGVEARVRIVAKEANNGNKKTDLSEWSTGHLLHLHIETLSTTIPVISRGGEVRRSQGGRRDLLLFDLPQNGGYEE